MKSLIIGLILISIIIAGCAPVQETAEQTTTITAEKAPAKETAETKATAETSETKAAETKTETKAETKTTSEVCGNKVCDRKETCDTCPKDCGECALDFAGLECTAENDRYTIRANIRNLGAVHQKQMAYPKVVFADSGVFAGELKELSIDPYTSRNFPYFFTLTAPAESVKVHFVSDEETIISKEITAECEIKE